MVRAVMAVEPDKTSLEDAVAVADEFGLGRTYSKADEPCDTHSECAWSREIGNRLPVDFPFFRYLGLRPWSITTSIGVRNAFVQGTNTSILVGSHGPEGDLLVNIGSNSLLGNRRAFEPMARVTYRYNPAFDLCWQFYVNTGPSPTSVVKHRALDINFDCLVSPVACKRMSELLPSAWADYERLEKKEVDWQKLEQLVKSDNRCHAEK
jgi:hypothetical protein